MSPHLRTALLLLALAACRRAPAATGDVATAPPVVVAGAAVYAKYCALCHGLHAEGYAADNAPSLVSSTFRETVTDDFLRTAIGRGRPGTAMAGYAQAVGGPLDPGAVQSLIAFVRFGVAPPVPPRDTVGGGSAANGKALFDVHCVTCHGTPDQRATAVHLANPALLASATDAFLRVAVERGRPGTPMEPFAGRLAPQEIADVLAYVRSLARPVPPPPPLPWAAGVVAAPLPIPVPLPNPAAPPPPTGANEPLLPLDGPVVLNPAGKAPEFTLKDDLYVPVAQLGQAFAQKRRVVVVDARTPSDFLRLHVAGAVSVPYYDMHDLAKIPNDGTWVVAYCACPHHVSGVVVEELRKRGYKHTAVLDEGVFFWQQQGNPVVAAAGQLPVAAPPPLGAVMPPMPAAKATPAPAAAPGPR